MLDRQKMIYFDDNTRDILEQYVAKYRANKATVIKGLVDDAYNLLIDVPREDLTSGPIRRKGSLTIRVSGDDIKKMEALREEYKHRSTQSLVRSLIVKHLRIHN